MIDDLIPVICALTIILLLAPFVALFYFIIPVEAFLPKELPFWYVFQTKIEVALGISALLLYIACCFFMNYKDK